MSDRIGRPTREKYQAFLDQALSLEFITIEEYEDRVTILQSATMMEDINTRVVHDFSRGQKSTWNDEWEKRRDRGLALPYELTPGKLPRMTAGNKILIAVAALGWVLFILSATGVL